MSLLLYSNPVHSEGIGAVPILHQKVFNGDTRLSGKLLFNSLTSVFKAALIQQGCMSMGREPGQQYF